MSRLRTYTRSLLSSYALLGVNAVYTLASLPLALKYLSKAEYGLWALTLQVATYISLVDLGMAGSISRILIDHKDDRASGRYGGAIKSGFLVGAVQGLIALGGGLLIVWFMGAWLRVPRESAHTFLWLMLGQVFLTAATFGSRLFGQILYAWQRIDICNYTQIVQLLAGLGALWLGFVCGLGVFSLLLGAVVGWASGVLLGLWACFRLGLWPKHGQWGHASREQFREMFSYGADLFLISIGTQLILSSQTVLVTRQLGMEAAALWSVMTKAFTVVSQLVWRMIGNTGPAFAEMHVRREMPRLLERYRTLFTTVSVLAGAGGVLFAACNGAFVTVWTAGQFAWPAVNDILLGLWLVVLTEQCCHNSLVICLKQVGWLKYAYLLEGLLFVGVTLAILPHAGMTGMLLCSLVATTLFTWLTGIWRVAGLLGSRLAPLFWEWHLPLLRVLGATVPCWLVAALLLRGAPDWLRLGAEGSLLGAVAAWTLARFALPRGLTAELITKLPGCLQRPMLLAARVRVQAPGVGEPS